MRQDLFLQETADFSGVGKNVLAVHLDSLHFGVPREQRLFQHFRHFTGYPGGAEYYDQYFQSAVLPYDAVIFFPRL
jgi:hypothetical protein